MVWVLLGPLAPIIAPQLGLTPAGKGFMVAVPTLAGAVLRLVNGLLVDRIGPKTTGTIGQVIVISGLSPAWFFGVDSYAGTLAVGVVPRFAGQLCRRAAHGLALVSARAPGKGDGRCRDGQIGGRCWRRFLPRHSPGSLAGTASSASP